MVKIQKGDICNVVTLEQYEKVYKPYGWELVKEEEKKEQDIPLDVLKNETELQNYIKMRAKTAKQFNDGLFKEEG